MSAEFCSTDLVLADGHHVQVWDDGDVQFDDFGHVTVLTVSLSDLKKMVAEAETYLAARKEYLAANKSLQRT